MLEWLFGNNKKKKKATTRSAKSSTSINNKNKTSSFKVNSIAKSIEIPEQIKYMDLKTIRKITHAIIQTYKTLEYNKKSDSSLGAKEWHSWQVGIMFKLYQSGDKVFIGKEDRNKIFPKNVLEGGESSAQRIVENLAEKYSSKVNIKANKDALSSEFAWSAREVGYLLYLITEE